MHSHASINAHFDHHRAPHTQSAFTLHLIPDPHVSYLCAPECPPAPWSNSTLVMHASTKWILSPSLCSICKHLLSGYLTQACAPCTFRHPQKYVTCAPGSKLSVIEDVRIDACTECQLRARCMVTRRILKGEISAVISIAEYACCKFCKSKVVSEDNLLAECSKCSALMKLSCCSQTKSAKFVVSEHSSGQETTLLAFEPVLSRIVDGVNGHSLPVKLLMAPRKLFRFNNRCVVFSVQNDN